jgi:hypothetical protein
LTVLLWTLFRASRAFTAVPFNLVLQSQSSRGRTILAAEEWKGDVVSNTQDGKIRGCTLQLVEGSSTEWIVFIDGIEADLGRFSEAVYRKVTRDAKQQSFQGFRPGTIPPHLEPTYRAFSMNECARETVLEALQQNNIRPFEAARTDMLLENFAIPPSMKKVKQKKRKSSLTKDEETSQEEPSKWLAFDSMKEAIDAGWKPGQSFSFVAKKVKGQRVKSKEETAGALPLGLDF